MNSFVAKFFTFQQGVIDDASEKNACIDRKLHNPNLFFSVINCHDLAINPTPLERFCNTPAAYIAAQREYDDRGATIVACEQGLKIFLNHCCATTIRLLKKQETALFDQASCNKTARVCASAYAIITNHSQTGEFD